MVSGNFTKKTKNLSTLTLKEVMLPFLAFGSQSVESSEIASQVTGLGHFIKGFDLRNSRSGFKARLQAV